MDRPDVLVLGAGGTLGEAWMRGLLDGIAAGADVDFRQCEYFVGTSAGSIVAAALAAGRAPDAGAKAAQEWAEAVAEAEAEGNVGAGAGDAAADTEEGATGAGGDFARGLGGRLGEAARGVGRAGVAAATPFVPAVLAGTAPVGRLARAAALRGIPRPTRTLPRLTGYLDSLQGTFDGRLRIAVVDRASGRRVMLGAPDAPHSHVSQAVLASCAIPWVFAPVEIAGREYVDGGVWSPTNLDAAPAGRGARVLCLIPLAGSNLPGARRANTAVAATEALAVRARGAQVTTIAPDEDCTRAFGPSLMDYRRRDAVAAAGYAQGRRLTASG
jgi:NTE family protein